MRLTGVTYDLATAEYPRFELEFETYGRPAVTLHNFKRVWNIDIQFKDPVLMEVTVRDLVVSCLGFLESHNPDYGPVLDLIKKVDIKESDIVDSTARDVTNVKELNAGRG